MVPAESMWATPEYMTDATIVIPSLLHFKPEMFGLPPFDDN
jgi:hypothetical protein